MSTTGAAVRWATLKIEDVIILDNRRAFVKSGHEQTNRVISAPTHMGARHTTTPRANVKIKTMKAKRRTMTRAALELRGLFRVHEL